MVENPIPPKKKKRSPPKKLPKIWQALDQTNAPISLSQWIHLDPRAAKDLADGVRWMRSREGRAKRHQQALNVNGLTVSESEDTDDDAVSNYFDSDGYTSEGSLLRTKNLTMSLRADPRSSPARGLWKWS